MAHSDRFVRLVDDVRPRVAEVGVDDVRPPGGDRTLVDVREESEWASGHIPDAVHIGRGVLERDVEAAFPDLDTPLVLYCGGGYRSVLAADALQRMGYTDVASLAGGWRAWTEAGLPTER